MKGKGIERKPADIIRNAGFFPILLLGPLRTAHENTHCELAMLAVGKVLLIVI